MLLARKGQLFTKQWMEANCKVVQVDQNLTHGLAEFGKFTAKLQENCNGKVFLECMLIGIPK